MRHLPFDAAKRVVGEGLKASLREIPHSIEGNVALHAITRMDPYEWDSVLSFLILGLQDAGIHFMEDET